MKQLFLIFLLGMTWQQTSAQPCKDCECILTKARALADDKNKPDYEAAIKQYNAARICDALKSATIDSEVVKVFVKISRLRETADSNAKVAIKALDELKTTSNQAVTLLLKEIDRNILYLDYDSTFQKCKVALELKEQREAVKKRIQEIAFWQVETDTLDFTTPLKTLALLDIAPMQKDKVTLLDLVKNIDTAHYNNVIWKRHFPEMVKVDGGEFLRNDGATIKVNTFWMAKTECTVWQYHLYLRAKKLKPNNTPTWQWQGDNPMVYVNWYDAAKYANWLSKRLNKKDMMYIDKGDDAMDRDSVGKEGFRLPTEAEWEYAARGGKSHSDFEFSGDSILDTVAWYGGNSNSRTHKVGTKKANALGIFDLSGNVWEWCNDWYDEYDSSKTNNPIGAERRGSRVLRGGSWYDNDKFLFGYCRVSDRLSDLPNLHYDINGFRVCLGTNP
ncbi:MAG: formylglycine-generating enzyme family protein [Bacteroidia bacterium]